MNPTASKSEPSTKRKRRTRAQLRDLMLRAGVDVLLEQPPSLGFDHLTYTAVFDRLREHYGQKVTIGSVHERLWASQDDYRLAVVSTALRQSIPQIHDAAFDRAAELIASFDLSTLHGRRRAVQTSIRVGSFFLNPDAVTTSTNLVAAARFRLWAMQLDESSSELATELADVIHDVRAASTTQYMRVVQALMTLARLRVRAEAGDPEQAIEAIAVLGNATMIGLQTDVLAAAQTPRQLPTGPDGELEAWYPDAIALMANVRSTLELDGDDLTTEQRRL